MKENLNSSQKPRLRVKSGEVLKTSNIDTPVSRLRLSDMGMGYSNLRNISDYVDQEQVSALKWPNSLATFDRMFYDHDVKLGYYLSQIFVEKAFDKPEVEFNKASEESKEAAEFVKWNLANMKHTLQEAIRNAYSCKRYGFSLLVKNYEPIKSGTYAGKYPYKLSSLSPRAQKTLDPTNPFIPNEKGDIAYARQSYKSFNNTYNLFSPKVMNTDGKSYVDIPRNKFMLFSYDSLNGNPLGQSALVSCYKAWKEKILIADYQTIGVSKDVGGSPVLYAPSEILGRAAEDINSDEAKFMKSLMQSLGNWHAGDTTHLVVPSDIAESSTTQRSFDVKLLGIDGGAGKQFDTTALIGERQKAILNAFGAGFAILGQSDSGSYALADAQKGTHAFFIEKDINYLLEVFNRELIPQLLALNDIRLESEDMPKLVHGVVDEVDIDKFSSAVQRTAATGMLVKTPEVINEVLEAIGFEYQIPVEDFTDPVKWEDFKQKFLPESVSRSGDGMKSGLNSGVGDAVTADDNSVSNLEN